MNAAVCNKVSAVLFLVFIICSAMQLPAGGEEALLRADFEQVIDYWQWSGKADCGFDGREPHGGALSARIAAQPDVERGQAGAEQSQWQYIVSGISGGDRFRASAWVRAKDLSDRKNAFLELEYLDSHGEPCGADRGLPENAADEKGWQKQTASGRAPDAACLVRVGLVLRGNGTAWFDDVELVRVERGASRPGRGPDRRNIVVGGRIVQPRFGGVGFQTFITHSYTQPHFEQVVGKRWRELNSSFARVVHYRKRSPKKFDESAAQLAFLKTTGTEVYMITDNAPDLESADERTAYAKEIVDELERFVRGHGLTNLKHYCMTNELSLGGWGRLGGDLPKFKDYHRALCEELRARKLDINMLATDASPISWWNTIHWATRNMDQYTGVYGGHHYISEFTPDDARFYPWFLCKLKWAAGMARERGKEFIIGEFGAKPDGRTVNGVIQDRCVYWDTPQEPMVSIQLAEATIAALNAGVYASCYWTFMDCQDLPGATYVNKWGLFRWSGEDYSTRPHYYAYGLLSKFFRGPAAVFRVDCDDPLLRIAAVRHHGKNTWSVAAVNRNRTAVPVGIRFPRGLERADFRKYVYDPARVSLHPFGDLPGPADTIKLADGSLNDTLGAGTLTIYTTAYDDQPPAAVEGLTVEKTEDGHRRLRWKPSPEDDLCYYRVFRSPGAEAGESRIASTIAAEFIDEKADPAAEYAYRVVAVDQSGNAR